MGRNQKLSSQTWLAMKNEYITSAISLRALAKKYTIAPCTVFDRARTEGWADARKELAREVEEASARISVSKPSTNAEKAEQTINNLLDKLVIASAMVTADDTRSIKEITQTMRDLRELQVFTLKDADEDAVRVSLMPEVDKYAD